MFAINSGEYCAHCGIWYTQGDTAYIESVVTIPQCRKIGLAKAVVYEALARVKELGAKRAIVLSNQEFYYKIGFEKSSTLVPGVNKLPVCLAEKEIEKFKITEVTNYK